MNLVVWLRRVMIALAMVIALGLGAAGLARYAYFSGGAYTPVDWDVSSPDAIEASLVADLDANPMLQGGLLYIDAPGFAASGAYAAGFAVPETGVPMRPDHVVRMASITKPYVAATALVLSEQGLLDLDAALTDVLSPGQLAQLQRGGYDTDAIRVIHLMAHTAGLPDYAANPVYILKAILADLRGTSNVWTPESQVGLAMDWANPLWDVGEGFRYGDTAYVLLGDAIEQATGLGLAQAVRETLDFDALGLTATYWEDLEPAPQGLERAHQYQGRVDTYDLDASIDLFGGGGLVANAADIGRAIRAIGLGQVFSNPDTRERMRRSTLDNFDGYGLGWEAVEAGGVQCWGHSGAWGLKALYCEDLDLTLVLSYSQANVAGLQDRVDRIVAAYQSFRHL